MMIIIIRITILAVVLDKIKVPQLESMLNIILFITINNKIYYLSLLSNQLYRINYAVIHQHAYLLLYFVLLRDIDRCGCKS